MGLRFTPQLLTALQPDANLAGCIARLDVNDPRAAADGAVFRVHLGCATPEIHENFFGLPTKRTGHVVRALHLPLFGHEPAPRSSLVFAAPAAQARRRFRA